MQPPSEEAKMIERLKPTFRAYKDDKLQSFISKLDPRR